MKRGSATFFPNKNLKSKPQKPFTNLVNQILKKKKDNSEADTTATETQ